MVPASAVLPLALSIAERTCIHTVDLQDGSCSDNDFVFGWAVDDGSPAVVRPAVAGWPAWPIRRAPVSGCSVAGNCR